LPADLFEVVFDQLPAREDRHPDGPLFPIGSADRLRMAIARACRDSGMRRSAPTISAIAGSAFSTIRGRAGLRSGRKLGNGTSRRRPTSTRTC
jgi:hypothetical protein